MKVAFVTDRVSRRAGGLFDACKHLAQSIHTQGVQIETFGVSDVESNEDEKSWVPVPLHLAKPTPALARSLAFAPDLRSSLVSASPDVVHLHGLWNYPSWASWRWRRTTGRAEVIHPHGMLDPWALKHSGWKKQLALACFEAAHLNGASCIRSLCDSELEAIRKMGVRSPICVIPNGINLPALKASSDHAVTRSASRKRLLYLGRLHPKKGLMEMIKAWEVFVKLYPESGWTLEIAGWDENDHESELMRLCDELGLKWQRTKKDKNFSEAGSNGSVTFHGPTFGDDKDALYRSADAFILPSLSEGLPMVILEAWAYAKPVLMTPACNLSVGVEYGAAFLIHANKASIADRLEKLASLTDGERAAMGKKGRDLVEKRFTWDHVATQLIQVNEWLINGHARPDHVHL
ncbi:glycosyltransferase [Phragmitibacter flavus]|uniref:Glycosyltransferase n=1 Tax=Phragmitibacter flavus TaxID=2576071 RepID=A0A5R8KCA8_9BACT|nr:glycosyltransferase [Phragmitibacter flavus]TLD69940.1 glycosyltransferase [Phragmitibacter flavus]